MINTDYPIEAWKLLLNRDCLGERYAPLLPYRDVLLAELPSLGCRRKTDAAALPDEGYLRIGLPDTEIVRLFRKFLTIYDPGPLKFREIDKIVSDPEERAVYRELYHLPGVKAIRASLYYRSGYCSLRDFTKTTVEEVRDRTARTIAELSLSCIVPLPKEVRTQIAVAQAFLWEETERGTGSAEE